MTDRNKPCQEINRLSFLIGQWVTEGQLKDGHNDHPAKIMGIDTYEWVAGECFILHRVDVKMGKEKVEAVELIGDYDSANRCFLMRSFDNLGEFNTMLASLEEEGVLKISGKNMRASLTVAEKGNRMTAHWERIENDGPWKPWMDIKLIRISG